MRPSPKAGSASMSASPSLQGSCRRMLAWRSPPRCLQATMAEAPTRCPLRKTFRKSRAGPSSLSWRTHFNLGMGACTFPETGLEASELHIFRKPFIARCCLCTARVKGWWSWKEH
ncbi:gtp cyclohydrolase ii [Nannochloropsis gaditana CCMP526]|uniref:gtp cyclohydrolase ii n=1 Tax=Nannochloropsis gaditana (strain CCMP526) TaxID=1093141 RepID=UPI00029F6F12|nr:gtp cyclohydrolase ii [Nannochloropsis gaditana CCMP526]EKU23001.1 gtp cyclohydrolase ii [Nannochloropsis gaditana CCMP526]|eukprot:XP_005853358.1 gtp cyclohydrolase ii [Nannochloropsis gaditana CCMP526]